MTIRLISLTALLAGCAVAVAQPAVGAPPPTYRNCTALQERYPHGVAREGARDQVRGSTKPVKTFLVSNAVYHANKRMDRDQDGVACEKR